MPTAIDISWQFWDMLSRGREGEPLEVPSSLKISGPPLVTVFGAGITGMSAAHELVDRGFTVQVVEPAKSVREEYACRVGGMAANQFDRVNARLEELHPELFASDTATDLPKLRLLRAVEMEPTQKRFVLTHRIRFKRISSENDWMALEDDHGVKNQGKLDDVLEVLRQAHELYLSEYEKAVERATNGSENPDTYLSAQVRQREILHVEVLGFTDTDQRQKKNRKTSEKWAKWVRTALIKLNADSPYPIPNLEHHLVARGVGAYDLLGDQRRQENRSRSNRVEFRIVEQVMPGEHGFRFFPSFYRNLFDSMRRTPVLDDMGRETGHSAYDQLVATPRAQIALAKDGEAPHDVNPRRVRSVRDLQKLLAVLMRRLGLTNRDLLRLQIPLLKYITCVRSRREDDCEAVNFWDYIGGDAAGYSAAAQQFIKNTPKALAAMSATETDARTQCTILIQMLLRLPFETPLDDATLNGSSTEAWLQVWKNYLCQKGVRFFVGSLEKLEYEPPDDGGEGTVVPIAKGEGDWNLPRPEDPRHRWIEPADNDFFVLALAYEKASDKVWEAILEMADGESRRDTGDAFDNRSDADKAAIINSLAQRAAGPTGQLMKFDQTAKRREPDGKKIERKRHPETGRPAEKADPLRDISGIQYFFPNSYRFGRGNVYYSDSRWGLTSISQLAYWRDKTHPIGEFIGQNSLDIGDWYEPFPAGGRTAWRSTKQRIATMTWEQVKLALDAEYSRSILPPQYYHLDDGIVFDEMEFAGFLGNIVLEVSAATMGQTYVIVLTVAAREFRVEICVAEDMESETLARQIAQRIDREGEGTRFLAVQRHNRILISPSVVSETVYIRVRGLSRHPYICRIGDRKHTVERPEDINNIVDQLVRARWNPDVQIEAAGAETIRVTFDGEPMPVAVANADDMIEILDGPELGIQVQNRDVQVVRQPTRSSDRIRRLTVRQSAEIQVSEVHTARLYKIRLNSGDGWIDANYSPKPGEKIVDVRDALLDQLKDTSSDFNFSKVGHDSAGGAGIEIALQTGRDASFFDIETWNVTIAEGLELLPIRNDWNFLINRPGQWRYRPGLSRAAPPNDAIVSPKSDAAEFWYSHQKQSRFFRWVIAGTFMATHTRMTTMEAANESARHAVNAILYNIKVSGAGEVRSPGKLVGEPCDIWDPEESEPDDLDYYKKLDQALYDEGLPHFLDILKVEEHVDRLPDYGLDQLPDWGEFNELLTQAQAKLLGGQAVADEGIDAFLDYIDKLVRGRFDN